MKAKTQLKTKTTKFGRNSNLKLGGPLPVRGMNQATGNHLKGCSPVSASSSNGQYGGQNVARGGEDYLAMVVQRYDGDWVYVRVNQHCLDIYSSPTVFSMGEADDLLEIWKRVVVDNAIPWEDSVKFETLRIVKYRLDVEDVTLSLFGNDQNIADFMRVSAMAKLSDAEARLLGLTNLKAKQKMIHNPQFHRDDQLVLRNLTSASASLPLGAMLSKLSVD